MFNREKAKALIKGRGRTREWVSSQCRVETQTLNTYLSGSRQPSAAVVALMAQALEVSESELMSDQETPKAS